MNIQKKIKKFTDSVLDGKKQEKSLRELINKLDELPFLLYEYQFDFDETEYPNPPEIDYQEISRKIEIKFPELGYYKSVEYDEQTLECTEKIIV